MKKTKKLEWIGAALIIAFALIMVSLGGEGYIDADLSKRITGAVFGLIFLVYGNSIPKKLKPLSDANCGSVRGQRLRRFAGWIFVITGLIYTVTWFVAPVNVAAISALALSLGAVLLVKVTCMRSKRISSGALGA